MKQAEDIWVEATVVEDDESYIRRKLEEINNLYRKISFYRIFTIVLSLLCLIGLFILLKAGANFTSFENSYAEYRELYNDDSLNESYQNGYNQGYNEGVSDYYDIRYDEGYNDGLIQNVDRVYNLGYNAGYEEGTGYSYKGSSTNNINHSAELREKAQSNAKNINMIPVESSFIASVGYDTSSNLLRINFSTGGTYDYFDVPAYIYRNFTKADSLGSYFNEHIKNVYIYERISD